MDTNSNAITAGYEKGEFSGANPAERGRAGIR